MSEKYMSAPPYCYGDIPEYCMPPMTGEATYFDFLEPNATKFRQPQSVGACSRLVRFIGMSKSTTLDGDGADVQESPNKLQGGGDKEVTVSKLHRTDSRRSEDGDHKTVTDMVEAEMDCKIVTDKVAVAEIDVNTNTANYKLSEESNDQTTDVHIVSSLNKDKEFTSSQLQLLDESPHLNDSINDDEVKPKKRFWKSLRKFFLRPFEGCLRTVQ